MLIALPVVLLGGVATEQCAPPPTPGGDLAGSGSWIATAYGPPWNAINGTGVTATGLNLTAGPPAYEIAVDPAVIPLQTFAHVQPNPFGTTRAFYAGDTGGAIIGRHVDIYDWKGRADQNAWGVRHVNVTPAPNPGSRQPAPGDHARADNDRELEPARRNDRRTTVRAARRKRDAGHGPRPAGADSPRRNRRRSQRRAGGGQARDRRRQRDPHQAIPRAGRALRLARVPVAGVRLLGRSVIRPLQRRACTANGPTCPGRSNPGDSPGPAHGSPCTPTRRHTWIVIAGLAFDTADYGGPNIPAGSGPRWRQDPLGNLADGLTYVARHPPGL